MHLQLDDVFARIGMRRGHVHGQPFVNGAIAIRHVTVVQKSRLGVRQISQIFSTKKARGNGKGIAPADTDNANPALPRCRRDGCNGGVFVHRTPYVSCKPGARLIDVETSDGRTSDIRLSGARPLEVSREPFRYAAFWRILIIARALHGTHSRLASLRS